MILPTALSDQNAEEDWHPRPLTLPEQIAEDVARRIINGEFEAGSKIGEVALAQRYGVSRGPIRDAIRELEKSGFVQIFPRRGAFIGRIDAKTVCDMFNVIASITGLAAQYCALFCDDDGLVEIRARFKGLEEIAADPACSPNAFAVASGRIGAAMGRNCQSDVIGRTMADAFNQTLWALIFREHAADYTTQERRQAVADLWRQIIDHIAEKNASGAEQLARKLLYDNRDETLRNLRISGGELLEERRLVRAND